MSDLVRAFIELGYKELEDKEDDTPRSGAMEYLQYLRDKDEKLRKE